MKKTLCLIVILAITFGTSFYALAQNESASPTSGRREAASRLVKILDPKNNFTGSTNSLMGPMLSQMESRGIAVEKVDQARQAIKEYDTAVASDPKFFEGVVTIYSELYTEEELNILVDFYSTTLGKKMIKNDPLIFQKSTALAQRLGEQHRAALTQKVQAIFMQ